MKKKWILCAVISVLLTGSALLPFGRKNEVWQETLEVSRTEQDRERLTLGESQKLHRGIYRVTVEYDADSTLHFLSAESGQYPDRVGCDGILLERGDREESFQVWVSGKVEDLQVYADYEGSGSLSLSGVEIRELTVGKVHDLVLALFGSSLLFLAVWLRGRMGKLWREDREGFFVIAGLGAVWLLSCIPLLRRDLILGHDSGFHFLRIEGLWRALLGGQFPVRIQPFWLHDYGYPVSIFYGDILLYLPSLLRPLGFSVQAVYKFFTAAVGGLTLLVAYGCLKGMLKDRRIAAAGSALYTLSLYRFANVYVRNAVGEYCAMIFLPLVVYGFWCILSGEKEGKKPWLPLLAGFTGLIETHVISCEFAGLFSVLVCVIFIRRIFQKERFLSLCKAAVGTVLINLWFLVPFGDYMLREHVAANTVLQEDSLLNCTIPLGQLFTPFVRWDAAPNSLPARIGLGLILGLALMAGVLVMGKWKKEERSLRCLAGSCLILAMAALLMTTDLVPWVKLKETALSVLTTIQFPWRLTGFATVLLVFGSCAAVLFVKRQWGRKAALLSMTLLVAGTLAGTGYTAATFLQERETESCYEERDAVYYVSGGEYLPSDVEFAENAFHPQEPLGEGIQIGSWEKGCLDITVTCENTLDKESMLEVPILLYRGYEVRDTATGEQFPMMRTETGMTAIVLPAGYVGTVEMRFREPWYWRASELVSLLSLSGVAVLRQRNRLPKKRC